MDIIVTDPPRSFTVGSQQDIVLTDCAYIHLQPNEQVTFKTESGAEHDVVRKSWGFYATASLNGRLPQFGLKAAFVKNAANRYYLCLVEQGQEEEFQAYLTTDCQKFVCWLDSTPLLQNFEKRDFA